MPPAPGSTGVSAQAASVSRSASAAGSRTFMGASVSAVRTWTAVRPSVVPVVVSRSGLAFASRPRIRRSRPNSNCSSASHSAKYGDTASQRRELVRERRRELRVGLQVRLVGPARDRAELHHHEALDVAAERVERLRGVAIGEAGAAEEPERELHRAHRVDRADRASLLGEQAHHGGMRLQEATPRARPSPAVLRPVLDGIGEFELRHDVLADPVEEVLLVLDVVVQRHRLDADLAGDPPHRDGLEALLVHDPESRLDHAIAGERLPGPYLVHVHVMSRLVARPVFGVDRLTIVRLVSVHRKRTPYVPQDRRDRGEPQMRINPESLARASSRHPWRTLDRWVVVFAAAGSTAGALLGRVLNNDIEFTNEPGVRPGAGHHRRTVRRAGTGASTEYRDRRRRTSRPIDDPAFAVVRR